MTLIGIILKLIEFLGLSSAEELRILSNDAKEYERSCAPDSEEKIKVMYWKLHQGIFFKLLGPFIYIISLREMKKVMNGDNDVFIE